MTSMVDIHIVPFDINSATQAEFEAVCSFRNQILLEHLPDDPPVPVEEQVQQARSIPPFVEVLFYYVWSEEGREVIAGLELETYREGENTHIIFASPGVLPANRGQGIGKALLSKAVEAARSRQRRLMMFQSFDTVPAGRIFLERMGAKPGLPVKMHQLKIAELDQHLVDGWLNPPAPTQERFEIDAWEHGYPEDQIESIAVLWELANQEPHGDLEIEDRTRTPAELRQINQMRLDRGLQPWTIYIREIDTGRLAGFTEAMWHPNRPTLLEQGFTGVFPEYRGLGLGKWLKAAMLQKVLAGRPEVAFIRTRNADSNAPMLKINTELGFKPYVAETIWQIETDQAEKYLNNMR